MKTFAAVAILASVAYAQIPNVPSCALNCFVNALTTDGCTSLTDFACHCQKTQLISTVTPCVQQACSADDQAKVLSTVESTCAGVGHPISISVPGSSAAASTPAPSSAAESTPVESTPAASTPESTPAASTPESTPAGTPTPYSSALGTAPTVSSPAGNATVTGASPTAFTGAAAATQIPALMAALGLAAIAL